MEKWEGTVSKTLPTTKPQQIWPLFKDFFNLHKYFPNLSNSYGVHGTNGEPGCMRYCLGSSIPPSKGGVESVSWSKERLVSVDEVNMRLCYEIVECNIGFKSYESTIRVSPKGDDGDGCVVEWGFSVEPVDGLRFEDLVRKYELGLEKMVLAMRDSLQM